MKRAGFVGGVAALAVPVAAMAAPFGNQSVVVVRSGDANFESANGAAVPAYLDEYALDGTLLQSIPLGNYSDLDNPQFTLLGGGGNSGLISRSYDGQYLVLGGYTATLGHGAPVSDASVPRTIARIGMDGTVDTSTKFTTSSTYEVRSTVSVDGSQFWVSTNSNSNKVRYIGSVGADTSTLVSNFNQNLTLGIYTDLAGDAQLYGTRNSNANAFYQLTRDADPNPKLPNGATGNATVTNLINNAADTSAWDFIIFNDNNTTLTLYLTDENATAESGIQKWTSTDGTTWTLQYILDGANMRGLTGALDPNGVPVLFASSSNGSDIYTLMDTGPGSQWSAFASAADGTWFHDVVLPISVPEPASLVLLGVGGALCVRRRRAI
jgi:hypothetical protein